MAEITLVIRDDRTTAADSTSGGNTGSGAGITSTSLSSLDVELEEPAEIKAEDQEGPAAPGHRDPCATPAAEPPAPGNWFQGTVAEGNEVDDQRAVASEDTPEEVILKQVNEKLQGKVFFTLGVANIAATIYLMASEHEAMIYFFSIKMIVLFLIRFGIYFMQKNHYFMLDFCYFGNFLLFAFLWFVPAAERPWFFMLVFGVTNVVMFHNSLVFHSMDKITSCFLHITPMIVSWCVRWHLQLDYHVCQPGTDPDSQCDHFGDQAWRIIAYSCAFFFAHQLLYYTVIQLFCMNCNEAFAQGKDSAGQDAYWTSFRWLTKNKQSAMARVVFALGPNLAPFVYGSINLMYCALTVCPTILFYNYKEAHTVFLVLMCLIVTWNGAGFYYEVFSKSHGVGRHAKGN